MWKYNCAIETIQRPVIVADSRLSFEIHRLIISILDLFIYKL